VSVTKVFHLSAAHHLPNHQGKCKNLHGHNYKVEISFRGPIQGSGPETGMVRDFSFLSIDAYDLITIYDHKNLNNFFPNPTAEVLAESWLLALRVQDIGYYKVVVWETDDSYACAEVSSK
jgi:6-pyruvoyltetrahydropterin/6-carboxytetrahydropterin synthase